jgi:hypothetical protein
MDRQEMKPPILARIPELKATGDQKSRARQPASGGRVIGQAWSFKLLAAATALLVVVAIVPFAIPKKDQSAGPSTAVNTAPAWQTGPSAPSANTAPAWSIPIAEVSAPARTPTGPTIPASPPATPSVFPQPNRADDSPVSASASTNTPMMSTWPNSAHPISSPEAGAGEPRASVNQAMAIRPEYLRNSHDRTGSGVH